MEYLFPWRVTGNPGRIRRFMLVAQVVFLNGLCLAFYVAVVWVVLRLFGVI